MLQYSTAIQLDAVDCAFNLCFLTNEPSDTEEIRGAKARNDMASHRLGLSPNVIYSCYRAKHEQNSKERGGLGEPQRCKGDITEEEGSWRSVDAFS